MNVNELFQKIKFNFTLFRFVVAFIFLVAAGLKAYQLATVPLPPVIRGSLFTPLLEFLNNRYFLMVVITGEILFGLILIAGVCRQWMWLFSIFIFSIFTFVSFLKGLSGEGSCNCFGNITVNPWLTTIFDSMMVFLLGIFRERLTFRIIISGRETQKLVAVLIVWIILTIPIFFAMLSFKQQSHVTLGTEFVGVDGTITMMLEPEKWIGKEFPLWDYVDEKSTSIKKGNWIIVIGRKQCEECQRIIEKLITKNSTSLALLELEDGSTDTDNQLPLYSFVSVRGTLKIDPNWIILTPCLIQCQDGICVATGENAVVP
jgi:hypothetical protein